MNQIDDRTLQSIEQCICDHSAVEKATVVRPEPDAGDRRPAAYVVPSYRTAPVLRRACDAEQDGSLDGLSLHEPASDLLIVQKNRTETEFLYREIFIEDTYFRSGILLPDNACVIDIGANIGMFSLCAFGRCPTARIIAIEPVQELCHALRANSRIHGIDMQVVNCAVGRSAGTTSFTYYPGNTVMSGRFADDKDDRDVLQAYLSSDDESYDEEVVSQLVASRMSPTLRDVPMKTVDQIVATHDVGMIDLLKIDVEKSELEILAGLSEETWSKVSQAVIEVHDIDKRVDDVRALFLARGFGVTIQEDDRLARANCFTLVALRPGEPKEPAFFARSANDTHFATRRALIESLDEHLKSRLANENLSVRFIVTGRLPQMVIGAASSPNDVETDDLTPTERVLMAMWQNELGAQPFAPDSDFFDAGGDSLAAASLAIGIQRRFGVGGIAIDTVFQTGRLRDLAALIDASVDAK